jgi:serine/threonine-protein kinase
VAGYLFLPGGPLASRWNLAQPKFGQSRSIPADTAFQPARPSVAATARSQPTDALDDPIVRAGWLRGYKGGDCFFAAAMSVSPGKVAIEGYGRGIEPFQDMLAAFERRFGVVPEIGLRVISDEQCAVADFLRNFPNAPGETPDLSLDKHDLTTADPMRGKVVAAAGAKTYLLLVDHEGLVHNLEARLKRSGSVARFDVPLGFGSAAPPGSEPSPQILIAIAGKERLKTMNFAGSPPASTILPRISSEVEARKLVMATSAQYLRIRR